MKQPFLIPYGRHWIDDADIEAVEEVLRSDWLTTGPKLPEFEEAMAACVEAREAVAVSTGTAALHTAMAAIDIGPGDEVIVPSMTFVGSANTVAMQGGTPVFADVAPDTLLVDPRAVEALVTSRTKALLAVDYAGQPCEYQALRAIADRYGLVLIADACHSLGAAEAGRPVGSLADLTVFSFHPVKAMTTGEGGMVVTNDRRLADKMRTFRNHGVTTDHRQRLEQGTWYYEMVDLGWNYRLSDIQCALGISQLRKLPGWVARRQAIARVYEEEFRHDHGIRPLRRRDSVTHAYHLYVVFLDLEYLGMTRSQIFEAFRGEGIAVQVHYIPVHCHPYYRQRFGTYPGLCPMAEAAYERILSLPMFPLLRDHEVERVIEVTRTIQQRATSHVNASSAMVVH